jgi:HAE1 family hydrophobic/amphiphilic exporter-1
LEKQYRVMIQAKAEDRANLESINSMWWTTGTKVAISQFVDFEKNLW